MFLLLWRVFLSSCCFQKSVYSFSFCRLFSQLKVVYRLMQNSFIAEPFHGPNPTMFNSQCTSSAISPWSKHHNSWNCKYVQKPFGNVSSDLSMLQMGHWSHVQLVWNGLNVCQEKWQICQGFNTNFMVLYFGVRKEKYHRVIIIIHWTRANSGIYHLLQLAEGASMKGSKWRRQQTDTYSEAAACHCPSSTIWLLHLKPWIAPLNFARGWKNRCQLVHQPNIFSCTKNLLHIKYSTSSKHSDTFRETRHLVKMLNPASTKHHLQLSSATPSYSQMTTYGAWDSSLKEHLFSKAINKTWRHKTSKSYLS